MTELMSLGYLGVETSRMDEWRTFAPGFLGMQAIEAGVHGLSLRMDDHQQRLFVEAGSSDTPSVYGWEVADAAALDRLAARLEAAQVKVTREPAALAERRFVKEVVSFADPAGNRLEAFWGAAKAMDPFIPGRAHSGFRTGALGLGHVVLTTPCVEDMIPFYRDLLGFKFTDYTLVPFKAFFFHLNARHHSFAVIETGKTGFHHLMVEMFNLDDIGQAYDLAQVQDRVSVTLGRHINDFMTSFYAKSPSGFLIECGWGGRSIDIDNWEPFECVDGPDLWGHDRSWLTPEGRQLASDLRIAAAAAGCRQPVQVTPGAFSVANAETY